MEELADTKRCTKKDGGVLKRDRDTYNTYIYITYIYIHIHIHNIYILYI